MPYVILTNFKNNLKWNTMKTIKILCLLAMLGFATGCKKDAATEPTVEQQEQGTLPDATAIDTVAPAVTDTIAKDSIAPPQ
jgi:hypothetical protein